MEGEEGESKRSGTLDLRVPNYNPLQILEILMEDFEFDTLTEKFVLFMEDCDFWFERTKPPPSPSHEFGACLEL